MSEREFSNWMRLSGGQPPEFVLRLPEPIVYLLLFKAWTKVAVPDCIESVNIQEGWASRRSANMEQLLVLRDAIQTLRATQKF